MQYGTGRATHNTQTLKLERDLTVLEGGSLPDRGLTKSRFMDNLISNLNLNIISQLFILKKFILTKDPSTNLISFQSSQEQIPP
jgi:hypothetical protein